MKDKYCHLCKEYGHTKADHGMGKSPSIYSGELATGHRY